MLPQQVCYFVSQFLILLVALKYKIVWSRTSLKLRCQQMIWVFKGFSCKLSGYKKRGHNFYLDRPSTVFYKCSGQNSMSLIEFWIVIFLRINLISSTAEIICLEFFAQIFIVATFYKSCCEILRKILFSLQIFDFAHEENKTYFEFWLQILDLFWKRRWH